ncbi:MAG TPA: recombinase RecB, partial [Methanocella sp.]|nr:recombinase RecB [Methanocella sp.]
VAGLRAESARVGRDRLQALLDPSERAQTIYSDRLRIAGTVDRVARLDGARCPVVVCASRPPENGIYAADRVKLAACAMLVEEKCGEAVDHGAVEYACGWRIREADVRKADRMAVLSTRNRIVQMGTAMPEGKRGPWCARCDHSGSCEVRPSLLSSMFRPVLTNSIAISRNETNK